jgi:hypothetical protein
MVFTVGVASHPSRKEQRRGEGGAPVVSRRLPTFTAMCPNGPVKRGLRKWSWLYEPLLFCW